MTDDAYFWTVNRARIISTERPESGIAFDDMLVSLLDRGFAAMQLMAIRKLVDRRTDVISLWRLTNEIKKNRGLLTRENYVCYDGAPYDYEKIEMAEINKLQPGQGPFLRSVPTSGPRAWSTSKRLHRIFDKLSGVSSENRSRLDLIQQKHFDDLFRQLRLCGKIEKVATERIAHIPDPGRQQGKRSRKLTEATFMDMEKAQKIVCRVATILGGHLLWEGSGSFVAQPQYDFLKNLSVSGLRDVDRSDLNSVWEECVERYDEWLNFDWPH